MQNKFQMSNKYGVRPTARGDPVLPSTTIHFNGYTPNFPPFFIPFHPLRILRLANQSFNPCDITFSQNTRCRLQLNSGGVRVGKNLDEVKDVLLDIHDGPENLHVQDRGLVSERGATQALGSKTTPRLI